MVRGLKIRKVSDKGAQTNQQGEVYVTISHRKVTRVLGDSVPVSSGLYISQDILIIGLPL